MSTHVSSADSLAPLHDRMTTDVTRPRIEVSSNGYIKLPDGRAYRIEQLQVNDKETLFLSTTEKNSEFARFAMLQLQAHLQAFYNQGNEVSANSKTLSVTLFNEKIIVNDSRGESKANSSTNLDAKRNLRTLGELVQTKLKDVPVSVLPEISKPVPQGVTDSVDDVPTEKPKPVKITDTHKVSVLSTRVKKTFVKVGVVALAVIFSPLLLIAGTAIRLGYKAHTVFRAKIYGDRLISATKKMKKAEEAQRFEGLKKIYVSNLSKGITDVKTITDSLSHPQLKNNKLARQMLRALARTGEIPSKKIQVELLQAASRLEDAAFKSVANLKNALKDPLIVLDDKTIETILTEIEATKPETIQKHAEELSRLISELSLLFDKAVGNHQTTNLEITDRLRKALESPAYLALKEDTENPSIQFLHELSAGIWNNVQPLAAYKSLGAQCLPVEYETQNTGSDVRHILEQSLTKARRELLTDHGIPGKILYAITHPLQTLGSMASLGGTSQTIAEAFGRGVYDSHGLLSNNPSLQGTTTLTVNGGQLRVNNCYGGSPTRGDPHISPEFRAVCQAAENNQLAATPNAAVPMVVYYTNFQNIHNKGGEGERSATIMRQNFEFPLSFRGMTLAKDSPFYLMRGDKSSLTFEAPEFAKEFFEVLMQDENFTLEGRKGQKGTGIYFPGNKEDWRPIISQILIKAETYFGRFGASSGEDAYRMRGAFQEYVYSMIQAYTEAALGKEVQQRTGIESPLVMAIRACKENIDRGGAENMKYLFTRLSETYDPKERIELVAGVMHSRALSARDRIILEDRLPQVLSFIEHISPVDFQLSMKDLLASLNLVVSDYAYTPALSPK